MRSFREPTARNLLRKPLVLGVPVQGLVLVALGVLVTSILCGNSFYGNLAALSFGLLSYGILRAFSVCMKSGWEESLVFPLERLIRVKNALGRLHVYPSRAEVIAPDTLEDADLLVAKELLLERIRDLRVDARLTFLCEIDEKGTRLHEVMTEGKFSLHRPQGLPSLSHGICADGDQVYSLYQLPVTTDPLWLFSILSRIDSPTKVLLAIRGVDPYETKRRIEFSRRSNARSDAKISDIDAEVTFEEASRVLQGLSRGDEKIVEISLVLASKKPLDLDPQIFCKEKNPALALASVLGVRRRLHRSHWVRAVTAADLIPNILDPEEAGPAILTTLRGKPLYFCPQDSRLEALHWLVVGASGSGKSFLTGLILRRMVQSGIPMSVLFVDHNRSFRRMIRADGGAYLEPRRLAELSEMTGTLFDLLNKEGSIMGLELSELDRAEKKAAAHSVLQKIEIFLRYRSSAHPIYVVLDECWNFMRDEPVLVQAAFREFRKLNGAVVAITQSLSDFLSDSSGQSIFQNAPIRILLRQGEDLARYQGMLGLNGVELSRVHALKQQRGVFSECLVKTPFLSRFGRLFPTEKEHELLRTDNLRAERVSEERRRLRASSAERGKVCEIL